MQTNVCSPDEKDLFSFIQASIGIANLLVNAMEEEGTPTEEAVAKIWMVDSRGLLVKVHFRFFSQFDKFNFSREIK